MIKSPCFRQRHGHLGHTAILSLLCSRLWPYGCVLDTGKWWTWLPQNALRKKHPPLPLYPFSLAARWVGCLELDCSTLDDMKEGTYRGCQSDELEAAWGPRWVQIWLVSSGLSTLAEKLTSILVKPQLYFDPSVMWLTQYYEERTLSAMVRLALSPQEDSGNLWVNGIIVP